MSPTDLGDGGSLHVFAEGAMPGVEAVDAVVELRPDIGRGDASDMRPWRALLDLRGEIETLRPRLGSPSLRRFDGQLA